MKSLNFRILILILILFQCCIRTDTIKVPQKINSIQTATINSTAGDRTLVSSGLYFENIMWLNKKIICLIPENGPDSSIIDGGNIYCYKVSSQTEREGYTDTKIYNKNKYVKSFS